MSSQTLRSLLIVPAIVGSLAATFLACGGGATDEGTGGTDFVSDDPSGNNGASGSPGGVDAGATSDTGAVPTEDGGSKDDPARAIEEADIVKVSGTRLYALSRMGGLSVIDVATRDKLKFLGRWRPNGQPFEMYVRDDVVLAMVNGFQEWSYESGSGGTVKQTSRVVALDVRDPAKISTVGDFAIPGEVSDSRVVGDVMYVVSFQNGYCWGCTSKPSTVVMSLGIKDPRTIAKVDQVAFTSPTASYSWWKRSVSATSTRFWIGGPEYTWTGKEKPKSTIQALDVSDPNGKLVLGASVGVDGMIQSRWQMDESAGVLRVISQPGWSGESPSVQTFTVKSSSEITPLGNMKLVLPKPESLMSVRFDGTRAYAITTERKDPLFTIDMTDPAKPVQKGELEMPGWVYYMEPRGNRLLGLGFDQGNPDGAMTVSLFDVSDLTTPKMIKRVNFGKGWASAPEDSDRIHKAFRVLDDEKLILVPYSSYDWRGSDGVCHRSESGIQLIDWKDDTLTLRGMAPVWGSPRRAFLHDQRMFAVSDGLVATYDIADRSKPVAKAELPLANPSHRAVVLGDHIASLSHDWWSSQPRLSITPRANIEQQLPIGAVDLSSLVADPACYYGWTSWWNASLFTNGGYVYLVVPIYDKSSSGALVAVVDARDPTSPKLVGKTTVEGAFAGDYYGYYGYYGYGYETVLTAGDRVVLAGSSLVSLRSTMTYESGKGYVVTGQELAVVDLRDPTKPRSAGKLALPKLQYTPLQIANGKVLTSHYEPIGDGKVRFYLDEIDVANPDVPLTLRSVNVPGSLLTFDPVSSRAMTVDYRRTVWSGIDDWSKCQTKAPNDSVVFDYSTKTCVTVHRSLRLVKVDGVFARLEQSLELPDARIGNLAIGDARVIVRSTGYGYYSDSYPGSSTPSDRVWVISGMREGLLETSAPISLDAGWGGGMWANGDRAVAYTGTRKLAVIDLSSAKTAKLVRTIELAGYYPYHVTMGTDAAYASLGDFGLGAVQLR